MTLTRVESRVNPPDVKCVTRKTCMFPHHIDENGLDLVPGSLPQTNISEFDRCTDQSLEIKLNTFTDHWNDLLLEPHKDHHLDIKVPLITDSQVPVGHVQVIRFDSSFGFTDQLFGVVQCNTCTANVSPAAPPFSSI